MLNRVSPVWRWLLFIPVAYGVALFASTRLAALLDTSPAAGALFERQTRAVEEMKA